MRRQGSGSPPAKPAPAAAAVLDSAKGMLIFAVLIEGVFSITWLVCWLACQWFWALGLAVLVGWSGFGFSGREAGKQGCRTFPSIWFRLVLVGFGLIGNGPGQTHSKG
jgi:hypothetical protein